MPSRNVTKEQAPDSYYHVYARGSNRQKIFIEAADYKYFLALFERYLSAKQARGKTGEPYPHYFEHSVRGQSLSFPDNYNIRKFLIC